MKICYFAYGSNQNSQDWQQWCKTRGLVCPPPKPVGVAYLPDYELRFSHRSQTRGGGALNVVPSPGRIVEGTLMELDAETALAMDRKEGAPNCYEAKELCVFDDLGHQRLVRVYILKPERDLDFVDPTSEYLRIVEEGLESALLPDDELHRAAQGKPSEPFSDAFFFYGTLMRGGNRFTALQSCGIEATLLGQIPGRLVDCGSYPGFLAVANQDDDLVEGDFVRVANIEQALEAIDKLVGFEGYCPESLFIRRLVQVQIGTRLRWAWTYEYNLSVRADRVKIPSGCWRTFCGSKESFVETLVDEHLDYATPDTVFNGLKRVYWHGWGEVNLPTTRHELIKAVATGEIDERKLSQASGLWTAGSDTVLPLD